MLLLRDRFLRKTDGKTVAHMHVDPCSSHVALCMIILLSMSNLQVALSVCLYIQYESSELCTFVARFRRNS